MPRLEWVINTNYIPSSHEEVLEVVATLRGFDEDFLKNPSLKRLGSYLEIRNIEEGACLVASHLDQNHKAVIVGDYDCDGITSAAQLVLFLKDIGYTDYSVVIPTRSEEYGFPKRAVEENPDAKIFIALDCGTHDVEAVQMARGLGADVVVIDHHRIVDVSRLAPASVIINPRHPNCPSVFKEFCSSGLTLLFLTRLRAFLPSRFYRPKLDSRYQALAAVGTTADVAPLVEANRIIVKSGLDRINKDRFLPFKILRELAGVGNKKLSAGHVGFYLAPRVNASGRMADPMTALSRGELSRESTFC